MYYKWCYHQVFKDHFEPFGGVFLQTIVKTIASNHQTIGLMMEQAIFHKKNDSDLRYLRTQQKDLNSYLILRGASPSLSSRSKSSTVIGLRTSNRSCCCSAEEALKKKAGVGWSHLLLFLRLASSSQTCMSLHLRRPNSLDPKSSALSFSSGTSSRSRGVVVERSEYSFTSSRVVDEEREGEKRVSSIQILLVVTGAGTLGDTGDARTPELGLGLAAAPSAKGLTCGWRCSSAASSLRLADSLSLARSLRCTFMCPPRAWADRNSRLQKLHE